ncbi:hypothetical protein EN836_14300 [Mesorhizobium sp. M1C.F.Ca.ET.193.01.1.1]|uniref:hypothetical protein n=1 Tax=unclassified Mesorhizobium TaxID=325217 RepID=UPI000FD55D05|nr:MULTISPECIES: hypothetical protein [unclassified Mesorhizobium]TGS99975.1 hypothetical protein EN820_33025 [bacterium M00.F.Ca.ET.177.01.1.1]TGQ53370.1 hypothetical protein EN853_14295 [Mesorhizobium sp. M1C.F.Ca.ET.210.01.1.1]TGQ70637.1 hypothetical protein EN855_014305 [Mesorhizobium sp. M1C.F.Ca.ET.212.01.1.1]TGR07210.1 hypothetical protein EN847_14295 [Mesorhizobium sp. M1C.F.Ca.ET.204.01.1.1]TGR28084.1 hypothetical protein EN839_14300 [Mesorhizobium sp. M1C.F.Ca.ET.196.01.1.1]
MTIRQNAAQAPLAQTARRSRGTVLHPFERLLALTDEWRTRREIERSIGRLSNFHLRDVGLTKFDVEAACADSFDRSASRALMSVGQKRSGNW